MIISSVNRAQEKSHTGCGLPQSSFVPPDWRYMGNGTVIPISKGYADQPYFLRADDGALVLICTTGKGHEGTPGQHVACVRSEDEGATWSDPVPLEPPDGVESSYAVMLKTPSGRIYAFYNHNTDNIRRIPADKASYPEGWCYRVDTLGHFVFRFSDDHGRTWSDKRYPIPIRAFEIDRENAFKGEVLYFWNVGRAFTHGKKAFVPLHKVGSIGINVFSRSEGAFLCSDNLLTEEDPEKIRWETLPDGDIGLRAPTGGGPIAEEQSAVVLSDGTIYCIYRTVAGHPAFSVSRDEGHTWTEPAYLTYPDGRKVKHPRAANFIWKLSGGRYLYWFHNHGERTYAHRNIVWCLGATEIDTPDGKSLAFTQPEVLLYNDHLTQGMSYPDLMELPDGDLLISETEKKNARMHRVPATFVSRLFDPPPLDPEDEVFTWMMGQDKLGAHPLPRLPVFYDHEPWTDWERTPNIDWRSGITLAMVLGAAAQPGILLDNRTEDGRGFAVRMTEARRLEMMLGDRYSGSCWTFAERICPDRDTAVALIVDGGPKIVSLIVDGRFDDGGADRVFGFGRFHPFLHSLNGGDLQIHPGVRECRIFARALMTSEALQLIAAPQNRR